MALSNEQLKPIQFLVGLSIIAFIIWLFITDKKESNSSALTQQQINFCEAINKSRATYKAEQEKEFYIDKDKKLTSIYHERTAQLVNILGDGKLDKWAGSIHKITVSEGRGAFLEIALSCGAYLSPTDAQIIPINSALFESLRRFPEKAEITFSGNLYVSPTKSISDYPYKAYYGEQSFTESGSIGKPEFIFKVNEIN